MLTRGCWQTLQLLGGRLTKMGRELPEGRHLQGAPYDGRSSQVGRTQLNGGTTMRACDHEEAPAGNRVAACFHPYTQVLLYVQGVCAQRRYLNVVNSVMCGSIHEA